MNKISKKNNRFANKLRKELKQLFPIKDFKTKAGYFIMSCNKYGVIYWNIGDYQFGIWQHSNEVFAEHKGNVDKFRPGRTEFYKQYKSITDIICFIKEVLQYNGDNLKEWEQYLKEEQEKEKFEQYAFNKMYQWILHYNGILKINILKYPNAFIERKLEVLLNKEISKYSDIEFHNWQEQFENDYMEYERELYKETEYIVEMPQLIFNIDYYEL